jgi:hypothetical protein
MKERMKEINEKKERERDGWYDGRVWWFWMATLETW